MTPVPNETASARIGQTAAKAAAPKGIRRLNVILIKPSKYDEEGYVMRYLRGVLPSNTLATLAGLTDEVRTSRALGEVAIETVMLDELVQKIDPRKLARKYLRRRDERTVVALAGVQTNQFPRAADLALALREAGFMVMMGGFHVSGAIAMSRSGMPPECQALLDRGITLVKGEVEEVWGDLLRDALHGQLAPYYDIVEPPDLSRASIPVIDPKLMNRFAYPYMGTIDAGRGCPFSCSFCTIINVQGRKMRNRLAECIKARVRENVALKIDYYFFTDDNFSRNPNWREIFEALIDLRENEGVDICFMMQVDVLAYRIKDFIGLARRAGCRQVFIGMETLNPENIPAAGKKQNNVEDYRRMIDAWHDVGIACHVGYIIGFPFDTVESVREDVRKLKEDIQVDQASFFMLTPLPGSMDHVRMVESGEWMDEDYNRFDSFRPVMKHPRMSGEEWFGVYQQAWRDFYTPDAMKAALRRASDNSYWGLFKNFVWYKHSAIIEATHPMICGFLRLKDRTERRPGFEPESRLRHLRRRAGELAHWVRGCWSLYFEMQDVWLATRGRAQIDQNLNDLRRRYREAVAQFGESAGARFPNGARRLADAQEAWNRAGERGRDRLDELHERMVRLRRQSMVMYRRRQRLTTRLNPFVIKAETRSDLDRYWRQTWVKVRRGRLLRINPLRLGLNLMRDVKLCLYFNLSFLLTGFSK